jgi:hypothetical protein
MDLKNTLLEGQHLPTAAEIIKTKNLLYQEGIGPPTHTPTVEFLGQTPQISWDQSRGGGGTSWVNPRKHRGGTTLSKASVRDFRGLERADINLVKIDKKGHLPGFEDPGGVPQHWRGGYQPTGDRRPVPGAPRKGTNAISTAKVEEEDAATVGMQMWPCDPFWKTFPPLKIDKPPAPI